MITRELVEEYKAELTEVRRMQAKGNPLAAAICQDNVDRLAPLFTAKQRRIMAAEVAAELKEQG